MKRFLKFETEIQKTHSFFFFFFGKEGVLKLCLFLNTSIKFAPNDE